MNPVLSFISNHIIELVALLFSLINLFLYYRTIRKEKVKLLITQNSEEAYSLRLTWYQQYNLSFLHIRVDNNSKSDTSISEVVLLDDSGKTYIASEFFLGDPYNKNGLTLFSQDETRYLYDLKSENLLNTTRIPSYGSVQGYLTFFDFPLLKTSSDFTLRIKTPSKEFKTKVIIHPLPQTLKPMYD